MYLLYTLDGLVHTSDASEVLRMYQQAVAAGSHPSVWRDTQIVVHIATCRDCGAPVLLTHAEVSDWVGRLEDGVLCAACSIRVLAQEQALYDEQEAWRWELERVYALAQWIRRDRSVHGQRRLDMDETWDEDEDPMDEALKKVADAMAVSVEDARRIFDSVGPVNAGEIVKGIAIDRETERVIEAAARTNEHWWQRKPPWWPR